MFAISHRCSRLLIKRAYNSVGRVFALHAKSLAFESPFVQFFFFPCILAVPLFLKWVKIFFLVHYHANQWKKQGTFCELFHPSRESPSEVIRWKRVTPAFP